MLTHVHQHETLFVEKLKLEGRVVIDIGREGTVSKREVATVRAMQQGADVIYHARLKKADFSGEADFLVRVESPSRLGPYSYEVWDTKLSKKPKAYYAIQLCCYAEMLATLQGST